MSAIHRVDDIRLMPARLFFPFAWRLPAYRGVMRERVTADQQENSAEPRGGYPAAAERRETPATRVAIMADRTLSGIFAFGDPSAQPDLREAAQQEYPELRTHE